MIHANNKETAKAFLNLIILGSIEEAYNKYVDLTGKHHNIHTPEGFLALKAGMQENHQLFPNKQFNIKRILEDGDMVAIYSNVILNADLNIAVVHMFRFSNNKIVEMWDCGQQIPKDSLNKDGAF